MIPDVRAVSTLRRAVPVLTREADRLLAQPPADAVALSLLASVVTALALASTAAEPERQGAMLTTQQMAQKLGITRKSLHRMMRSHRIEPAVKVGRFARWTGAEAQTARALGPVAVVARPTRGRRRPA